jgi:glycosyltransferase involved in cell wall biosynthesis
VPFRAPLVNGLTRAERRPRILFPFPAKSSLHSFVQADYELLNARYEVVVSRCHSPRDMAATVARVAKFDAVFCWFGSIRYLPVIAAARVLGRPVVIVAGGYDVADERAIGYGNMRPGLTRQLGRLVFRLATRVLPYSRFAANEAADNARVAGDRSTMIYLGLDTVQGADANPAHKDNSVLTIATLDESSIVRKGVLTLVRASRLMPDTPFVIAGRATAGALALLQREAGPNVRFTGYLTDAERADAYRRAKVYAQPSVHEAFGYAVAEAMLHHCVPVVSSRGSLPEVAGPFGHYVTTDDASALAAALKNALASPPPAGASTRSFIEQNFSLERRRVALTAVMESVLGGR